MILPGFSVTAHWAGEFDEGELQVWARELRARLDQPEVSLGLVFLSPSLFPHVEAILEILRVHAKIPLLAGCSSQGLISGAEEIEKKAGVALGLYYLPGAKLDAYHFTQEQLDESNGPAYWRLETGIEPPQNNGWLVFADPFHLDCERWLTEWNEAYPKRPILGGLASGEPAEQRTQVYLNGSIFEAGGVAISFGGRVGLASVLSQGCTPIGETWTITRAEENLIHQIGNRPAYEVLAETFSSLTAEEQKSARGNLFIGLVINEYLEEFHRGDFLIRNLMGADPKSGTLAVAALPRAGQTIQFQRRDSGAATEDLSQLLARAANDLLQKERIYGGCLSICNGRGQRLFGAPHHDAALIQKVLGPLGLTGFFCNGEIGPVGDRSFLHGYTASLALFLETSAAEQ